MTESNFLEPSPPVDGAAPGNGDPLSLEQFRLMSPEQRKALPIGVAGRFYAEMMVESLNAQTRDRPAGKSHSPKGRSRDGAMEAEVIQGQRAGLMVGAVMLNAGPGSVGLMVRDSVNDHVERARFFVEQSRRTSLPERKNWLLLAGVNSAVAAFEIMKTRYESVFKQPPRPMVEDAASHVRHFELLGDVRAHDFHRQAVGLSESGRGFMGPVICRSGSGPNATAGVTMNPATGQLEKIESGNASMRANRMLQVNGFRLLDPASDEWVSLEQAILDYVADLPPFLEKHFPGGRG